MQYFDGTHLIRVRQSADSKLIRVDTAPADAQGNRTGEWHNCQRFGEKMLAYESFLQCLLAADEKARVRHG